MKPLYKLFVLAGCFLCSCTPEESTNSPSKTDSSEVTSSLIDSSSEIENSSESSSSWNGLSNGGIYSGNN